ncbi:MAG: hypothetical protein GEU76_16150 [Alphaproteobacteria bacterium]|nr:hypothetical protein [Alphaproteobacteria bacterium]
MLLLVGLLAGWSAQAFSLVMTGACVASMDATDTGLTDPVENTGDKAVDVPCEGVSPRCMGGLGCTISMGLPQASFDVGAPGLDPVITEEVVERPNALAQGIGHLSGPATYEQVVVSRCRPLWMNA